MEAHAASASIEKISLREGSGGSRRRENVPAGSRLLRSKTDVKRKAQHEERKSLGTKFCIGILEKGKLEKKKGSVKHHHRLEKLANRIDSETVNWRGEGYATRSKVKGLIMTLRSKSSKK